MKSIICQKFKAMLVAAGLFAGLGAANANNLQITGTSVAGSNITFNISWDNSWYASLAPGNWDGVWVFVKYQDCSTRQWYHAGLSTTSADHSVGAPLQVDAVTDGKGVFIHRSAFGAGNISSTAVTLKMTIAAGTYNYKVFGVEMVNIPQGSFDVGDGASTSRFNSINIDATAQSSGLASTTLGTSVSVPAAYPMGYNSLYCMKYELTTEQYMEFLNTLTYDQQKARTANDPISPAGTYAMTAGYYYRNGIRISVPGNNNVLPAVYSCDATAGGGENGTNDGQNIPLTSCSWGDLTAYLDWAALRPMTEIEFEKICRGPVGRVAGEYVWGSTALTQLNSNNMTNPLQSGEYYAGTVVNGLCLNGLNSSSTAFGPARAGVFATSTSGRESAGATYYGVMDMGGNVRERVVSAGNASGVAYTGVLGDGTLTTLGDPNQTNWPSPTTALGAGDRGGNWVGVAGEVRTSDRSNATNTDPNRTYVSGGRGVR